MTSKTLNATVREKVGKVSSRQLRQRGKIPAVVYGRGEPLHISIDEREFGKEFKVLSESTLIDLKLGNTVRKVLLKDFQEHLLSGRILHLDFLEVDQRKPIRTHVSVHTRGTSPGQKEGGILEILAHSLEIECLPEDLPEAIEVDISQLGLGQTIHLRDIQPPKGVHILGHPDLPVVHVTTVKVHLETPQTESTSEPQGGSTPSSS